MLSADNQFLYLRLSLMSDFDTMVLLWLLLSRAASLTEDGNVKDIKQILIVDSAACFGASSVTTFVVHLVLPMVVVWCSLFSLVCSLCSSVHCTSYFYRQLQAPGHIPDVSRVTEIDWNDLLRASPAFYGYYLPMTFICNQLASFLRCCSCNRWR